MSLPSQEFGIGLQGLEINSSRVADNVRPSRNDHQSMTLVFSDTKGKYER